MGDVVNERRAHWDDELIYTVMRILNDRLQATIGDRTAYAVIVAVEDWQTEQVREENLPLLVELLNAEARNNVLRADKAEAQVEAVREAAKKFVPIVSGHQPADQLTRVQTLRDAEDIRRALDGGNGE